MLNKAIEVKNLSKIYRLGSLNFQSFKKSIISFLNGKLNLEDQFYAIKKVNFEIFKGDSVALIGRNGAGKSTFLKILTKITLPTEGKIFYKGKLLPLLSTNIGLHGEFTGLENILFIGTMLGYENDFLKKKIDNILDFAEINNFANTPVKHFSTGMNVRLIFSIVACLEPDILVLDEILATADSDFKEKSIKRLQTLNDKGTTLILVSHEEELVKKICEYGIVFNRGEVGKKKPISEALLDYKKIL
jgi:ABC-type polysaccharide/polyol phosphate transport system ATPase subunit